jgi:plastocyanin
METSMNQRLFVLVTLLVLSVTLFACGESGPTTDIEVNMVEFTFTPDEFTIPAGQEITITATNNGAVNHDFVIFKLGTDAGDKFDDEDKANIYWQVEVGSGQSTTTTFVAPGEPGEYAITCGIEGHLQAGMSGKLIVVAAGD